MFVHGGGSGNEQDFPVEYLLAHFGVKVRRFASSSRLIAPHSVVSVVRFLMPICLSLWLLPSPLKRAQHWRIMSKGRQCWFVVDRVRS